MSDSDNSIENSSEDTVENKEVVEKSVQTEMKEKMEKVAESFFQDKDDKFEYPLLNIYGDLPFFTPDGIYTPINKMTMVLFKETLGSKIVKDLDNYEKAEKDYTKAIKLGDNVPRNYFNRGLSKRLMEDSKGACEDWKKAAELGHKDAEELFNKYCS